MIVSQIECLIRTKIYLGLVGLVGRWSVETLSLMCVLNVEKKNPL